LGVENLGVIIRGGVEGIQVQPDIMTKKLFEVMTTLGTELGKNGAISNDLILNTSNMEHLSKGFHFFLRILKITGLADLYWNGNLKKNKAYDKRFARPLDIN